MGINRNNVSSNSCLYRPGITLGIVGGGQLGRMLAFEAKKMGLTVVVLDPKLDAPAAQVADKQIQGDFADLDKYLRLAEVSDVVTYEFEHINVQGLAKIEEHGTLLRPGSKTLQTIQDKSEQKQYLSEHGISVPDFRLVHNIEEAEQVVQELSFPGMAKTARGGHDGKGNYLLKCQADITDLKTLLDADEHPVILEEYLEFDKEVSVMAAIGSHGEYSIFPVVENYHYQEILHQTWAPADISVELTHKVEDMAQRIVRMFQDPGIYGIEFFLKGDRVLVNEIAPRVHNSGHYSMEACSISQFQMHLRSILGLPLPESELIKPAVMVNLLGTSLSELPLWDFENLFGQSETYLHLYGKGEIRPGRKMGHINILGESHQVLKSRLMALNLDNIKKDSN